MRGVTGDSSREKELGKGKWTEEPVRSKEKLDHELPGGNVRTMEIEEQGRGPGLWIALGALALVVLLGLIWSVGRGPQAEVEPIPPGAPVGVASPPPPPSVAAVLPAGPSVTVDTRPPRGQVLLNGVDQGLAPATVAVPMDSAVHELCVVHAEKKTCRKLTGSALAASDPYVFDTN